MMCRITVPLQVFGAEQHLGQAFARNARNIGAWSSETHAHCRRQAESHRAKPARIYPAPGLIELVKLRCPHLMLADIGGNECFALRHLVQLLEHILRLDDLTVALVLEAVAASPLVHLSPPLLQR